MPALHAVMGAQLAPAVSITDQMHIPRHRCRQFSKQKTSYVEQKLHMGLNADSWTSVQKEIQRASVLPCMPWHVDSLTLAYAVVQEGCNVLL